MFIGPKGWTDERGNTWAPSKAPRAEPGWLFSSRISGTICFERGRWACYRLMAQITPCSVWDSLHEAAAFMAEARA